MKAVNLTMQHVELAPVNGAGTLAPAIPESDGAHERELGEVTEREQALADAGTIALLDSAGRRRKPKPPADDDENTNGGD